MYTKIIATINPKIKNKILKEIISSGASIIRLNTKYIPLEKLDNIIEKIKKYKGKVLIDIKKRKKLKFLIEKKFDYLAISFAENPKEIKEIKEQFPKKIKIISKIETKKGWKNIDSLIKVSNGIMIARGDLGHDIPFQQLPLIQKTITKKCNKKRIMSITATEIMPSMVNHIRPSRAEVSDIANAVLEGSDALLLAEETAIGKSPVLVVKTLKKIIKETENTQ